MANNYIITSVTTLGDILIVVGSVNGIPVTVVTWASATSLASAVAFENFISPLMLAQAIPITPTAVPVLQGLTFSK